MLQAANYQIQKNFTINLYIWHGLCMLTDWKWYDGHCPSAGSSHCDALKGAFASSRWCDQATTSTWFRMAWQTFRDMSLILLLNFGPKLASRYIKLVCFFQKMLIIHNFGTWWHGIRIQSFPYWLDISLRWKIVGNQHMHESWSRHENHWPASVTVPASPCKLVMPSTSI